MSLRRVGPSNSKLKMAEESEASGLVIGIPCCCNPNVSMDVHIEFHHSETPNLGSRPVQIAGLDDPNLSNLNRFFHLTGATRRRPTIVFASIPGFQ